jgi:hypothetical protein
VDHRHCRRLHRHRHRHHRRHHHHRHHCHHHHLWCWWTPCVAVARCALRRAWLLEGWRPGCCG